MAVLRTLAGTVAAMIPSLHAAPEHVIVFDSPAAHFTEACPLGNGRLGALVFGGGDGGRIVLNEAGMWSGSPQEADRSDAAAGLPRIRALLLEGRNAEAEAEVARAFTCAGAGSGFGRGAEVPYGSYQLLADLRVESLDIREPTAYRRTLDLEGAVARTTLVRGGITVTETTFTSQADDIGVHRIEADRAGSLTYGVRLSRPERARVSVDAEAATLVLSGDLPDGHGGTGVGFAAVVSVHASGGTVTAADGGLRVTGADAVEVRFAGATRIQSFAGRRVEDPVATCRADLAAVSGLGVAELLERHQARHRALFRRVALELGTPSPELSGLTTLRRLERHAAGNPDPGLAQLAFDFGRYLLISSTRPGGFPPNLQGIWADGIQTPWNGDWHLNVNVQMNLWPAETCALPELHGPLFALIDSLTGPGARTAKAYYGARGWVAHMMTNPWGFTSPGEQASWGATATGSAWLCHHLWEHWRFSGDRAFLERAYPVLKGSAEFYLDMLIKEPRTGWLVTAPANSPENAFVLPDGTHAHVCLGPTFDTQIVRFLFSATAEAAEVLGTDPALAEELRAKVGRLPPTRIGPDGRVLEWLEPYAEADPQHRHVSHLWGLYPGDEITPAATPALAEAARRTLDVRGDGGTGWSLAHKLALRARLGDGERAGGLLREFLRPAGRREGISVKGGGSYPNLFCAHPPFQIDGNLGTTAAIAEMLLQSHGDALDLLPALPADWARGRVSGLRARGGFTVDLAWEDGQPTSVSLRGKPGSLVRLRHRGVEGAITLPAGGAWSGTFPEAGPRER